MRVIRYSTLFIIIAALYCNQKDNTSDNMIVQGKLNCDFNFAELSAEYLETQDPNYLNHLVALDATEHLKNHTKYFCKQ